MCRQSPFSLFSFLLCRFLRPPNMPQNCRFGSFSKCKMAVQNEYEKLTDFSLITPFWLPFGGSLGSKMATKIVSTMCLQRLHAHLVPKKSQRGPRRPQKGSKRSPKGPPRGGQEGPKRPPRDPKRSLRSPQEASKRPQEPPKTPQDAPRATQEVTKKHQKHQKHRDYR